jgi:Leucine-rich repeat (LRR) protein
MKKVAILFIVLLTSSFVFAQNTYVPDDNFEQALIDLGYDTTLDDYVVTANISGVTSLDVEAKEISDLTGIEAFTALTWLECSDNQLTSLDVSANTALTNLHFSQNQLTSLDLSNNTALTGLACYGNKLTSLDLSNNTALTGLYSNTNQLTNLDLSNNTALTNLHIGSNQLTNLDISNNTALTELFCAYNQLTSLDVSKNTALKTLECFNNKLTSLDVSNNTALEILDCRFNQLTSLDVSANTALTNLDCYDNQLTSLDVSANTALTGLHFGSNQLTSLDVSSNTALTFLDCSGNQLTSLNVSNNTALEVLHCYNNQLTSLDVSSNTALTELYCNNNLLTYLNMKNGLTDQYTEGSTTNNSLTCIELLDPAWATANWTSSNGNIDIDAGVTFSVICGGTDLTTWHVDTTGSDGSGSGTETSPLATIQTGINAASDGDTVSVAAGTYVENILINKSIKVFGQGPETTIVDGDSARHVVYIPSSTEPQVHLYGFTIKNGIAWPEIEGRDGENMGGGILSEGGSSVFENLIIENNRGSYGGGGTFVGGAFHTDNCSDVIRNVIFRNNIGGVVNTFNGVAIENSLFINNTAGTVIQTTGGLSCITSLINVTMTNNQSYCLEVDNGNSAVVSNSLFYNNESKTFKIEGDANGIEETNLYVSNSLVQDGISSIDTVGNSNQVSLTWGSSNIDVNPMFVDTANGNYHLKDWSKAIGAGAETISTDGATYTIHATDIEGNPRPNPAGSNPDMGAFENKWGTPQNAPPVLSALPDVSVNEDESITVTLEAINADSADNDAITFSATSEKSEVKLSMGSVSGKVNISADENWNGSSVITVYASDGKDMDSTKFNLTVDPMQDKPYNFNWVSTASDSINITQSNLTDTYDLKWNTSNEVDGETIDYLISASVGQLPAEMINETADTSMTITYQDIIDKWYPNLEMLPRATLKFSVSATDGIDTLNVTGDDRVLFVNRYEYLSTEGEGVPVEFALHENYPNPFNPTTTLRFDLPEVSNLTLTIYNMLGQRVRTFNMNDTPAGYHSIKWNATNDYGEQVGAGVYLYQLQTKDFVKTRKMVLLK